MSRHVAATIGVLAVWAAVGVGHLVAGLISASSSPLLAVGGAVIRLAPESLTEFGKNTFGTNDKLVLLGATFSGITLLGAVAGLLSRERPNPGVWVLAAMGVLGTAAVYFAPVYSELDLVAPAVAALAGIGAFRWLRHLGLRARGPVAAGEDGVSRRAVLAAGSAAVGLGALASAGVGTVVARDVQGSRAEVTAQLARATFLERATSVRGAAAFPQLGTPTFLTANSDFYRIDTALRIPTLAAADWQLRVHGMVARELTLSFADLIGRPLVERPITMTCVSNPVGGSLISTADFIGVPLRDILLEAGVDPAADQLFSRSTEDWYTGTPMSVLMEPQRGALLAIGMNGEALPPEHGFPVRMVVPGLYGYVSGTKWVVDIEATVFKNPFRQGFWLERGWSQFGPIKTMSRIDAPQDSMTVIADTVTVAGVAWAQHTGIAEVEVRVDGGPWQPAMLSDEISIDTWRMWHVELALPKGDHTAEARATDKSGYTQTDQRAQPIPNGASGWPSVSFTVG
ncbi:MAG: molybdopterin-dependent oxidoreductase [Pseudonocardiales bacterium]|nr:molybdopterin-dependent oxidoreductase [Pseudonocardiales bacterium]